eukprot:JP436590.1.p2 GENE.JP436590.1~~JP436590.1.p2  ORF type:complete len:82 (-),score=7.77 JP436590.1:166-411(-)
MNDKFSVEGFTGERNRIRVCKCIMQVRTVELVYGNIHQSFKANTSLKFCHKAEFVSITYLINCVLSCMRKKTGEILHENIE